MRSIPLLILLALGLLLAPCRAGAQDLIEKELKTQKERLHVLQEEIRHRKERYRAVEQGKRSVLQELRELDEKIARQWERLRETKEEWTRKELELVSARKAFKEQEAALRALKERVKARLISISEMGPVGILNVLFAAESVPELLSRETYLKFLLRRDEIQRRTYVERLSAIRQMQERLERDKEELRKASSRIEEQALALEEKREERRAFLEELKEQSTRYMELISELEKAGRSLKDMIARLDLQASHGKGGSCAGQGAGPPSFLSQKGRLGPPAFGKIRRAWLGPKEAPGVVIETPWGSEVSALFDGTVVYSGRLKGYGNVLIIDHGEGYLSMVAQISELFKKAGEEVKEGELVGLAGGGPWIDEGIYLEIRHNGRHEDPLSWLDPRLCDIQGDHPAPPRPSR